jgi:hypothetical protein
LRHQRRVGFNRSLHLGGCDDFRLDLVRNLVGLIGDIAFDVAMGTTLDVTFGFVVDRAFGGILCHFDSLLLFRPPKHVCRLFGENITLTESRGQ